MNKTSKILALATLMGAGLLAAQPASAATCVLNVCTQALVVNNGTGPLSLTLPDSDTGTVTALKLISGNTYDFTFSTDATYDVLSQLQAAISNGAHKPPTSLDIAFDLYSGTPGSGTLLGSTLLTVGPSFDEVLGAGSYYLQVNPSDIVKNMELTSGSVSISAALPEPATWLSMIFGFGMLGGLMRFTRRASLTTAA